MTPAQVCAEPYLPLNGFDNGRVTMPEEKRAVAHPEVNIFTSINIPLTGALGAAEVDRLYVAEVAVVVCHAAGEDFKSALEQFMGPVGFVILHLRLAHALYEFCVTTYMMSISCSGCSAGDGLCD